MARIVYAIPSNVKSRIVYGSNEKLMILDLFVMFFVVCRTKIDECDKLKDC